MIWGFLTIQNLVVYLNMFVTQFGHSSGDEYG